MASPSSVTSRNYSYNVFASFHGPDVRKTLLSHMREQFNRSGITMFDDQKIETSATIDPSLTKAIRESRISIVILSKRYASSGWCLDELVEILETKKTMGQIVMTIFYGVEPSHVRKQTGEFGVAFNETCARKIPTDEQRQKWREALNDVGIIKGEDFLRWDNEAEMIKKIAKDVLDKLNATPSKDFDGMVGLEAHLREMESLLDLDYDGVKMVAISGPAGIGKSTIARALEKSLSNRFQLTCFVDNLILRESDPDGFDEYGLKLRLQQKFLSKILNQDGMRIHHLGAIKERLCGQRVLIILDDVNSRKQLVALANEITWFGPGSRIVVTTENKELLQQHGINITYHVRFPSDFEALKILCRYAFGKSSMHLGFEWLARRVIELCGNLPLGLCVVGSSLRGKNGKEWEEVIRSLESIPDYQDIEKVLRVGYECLGEDQQSLFLHIAVFFNCEDGDLVEVMFADKNLDIKHGLDILVYRSLVYISTEGKIMMHKLLQRVCKKVVRKEEPWKRMIVIEDREIRDVLEYDQGTRAVSGISFDVSACNDEVSISKKAFKKMPNLRFLRVYKSKDDGNDVLHIPEEIKFPRRLRFLQWEAYPNKRLPPTFHPEYLVKLNMEESQLEYLWQGTQPLTNLKEIDLSNSCQLKELPDLSNATNLKRMNMSLCMNLEKIPSSFSHLHKLQFLNMSYCINLQVIPAHLNLASLDYLDMDGCTKLRNFPDISTNITELFIGETSVEDLPASTRLCSRLRTLNISGNGNHKGLTHLPTCLITLYICYTDIEKIPESIKELRRLHKLDIFGCRRLTSIAELPGSLRSLHANDCESLETVFFPLNANDCDPLETVFFPIKTPRAVFCFTNCFKLDQQTQRAITQRSFHYGNTRLPGKEVPAEFDHRAGGNSLTICLDDNKLLLITFKFCLVISPNNQIGNWSSQSVLCRHIINGELDPNEEEFRGNTMSNCRTEHLFIFISGLQYFHSGKMSGEVVFEFRSKDQDLDILECGAQILSQEYFHKSNDCNEDAAGLTQSVNQSGSTSRTLEGLVAEQSGAKGMLLRWK